MEKTEEEKAFPVWVNWDRRVISFQEAEGFEVIYFQTHGQMLDFAVSKGTEGFGLQ